MGVTIGDIMRQCRNFFERGYRDGAFTIKDGAFFGAEIGPGGYIAICGSRLNDGVYHVGEGGILDGATDEEFTGRVWYLAPPRGFLALAEDIAAYDRENPPGGYVSESFGAYSYTKASSQGGPQSWQSAFCSRLAAYQRMYTEVTA